MYYTDLHRKNANKFGNSNYISSLISSRENINLTECNGATVLHWAVSYNNYEGCLLLLEKGANVNSQDQNGYTPLHYAFINDKKYNMDVIKLLLLHNANINSLPKVGMTPFEYAIYSQNLECVKLLIDYGANINTKNSIGEYHIFSAIKTFNMEMVHFLIERGADVNVISENGGTLLHWISGINTSTKYGSKLTNKQLIEIVLLLLDMGVDINNQTIEKDTALHRACWVENYELIKLLIDRGANLNVQNNNGNTPLHYSCSYSSNSECILFLLDCGSDYQIKDKKGRTPFELIILNSIECNIQKSEELKRFLEEYVTAGIATKSAK